MSSRERRFRESVRNTLTHEHDRIAAYQMYAFMEGTAFDLMIPRYLLFAGAFFGGMLWYIGADSDLSILSALAGAILGWSIGRLFIARGPALRNASLGIETALRNPLVNKGAVISAVHQGVPKLFGIADRTFPDLKLNASLDKEAA